VEHMGETVDYNPARAARASPMSARRRRTTSHPLLRSRPFVT